MSILIHEEDKSSHNSFINNIKNKLRINVVNYTAASIIKRVSPTIIINENSKLIPKMKINDESDLKLSTNELINILPNYNDKIICIENEINKKETISEIEVLKNQFNQENALTRKIELDQANLLRGFKYAFDTFNNCSKEIIKDEDYELTYSSLDDRLKSIFE